MSALPSSTGNVKKRPVWIDLDNTPHVPFFAPIAAGLRAQEFPVIITARDAYQVRELAEHAGLECRFIGRHLGANPVLKVAGYLGRGLQLLPTALQRPQLGLSHGARSQILACRLAGIPSVELMDYEHAATPPLATPDWEIVPKTIEDSGFKRRARRGVLTYRGLKEDVYASGFTPDPGILLDLGLNQPWLVVTVRPPATEAHYHNSESEALLDATIAHILSEPTARIVLLPRNTRQRDALHETRSAWFSGGRVLVPKSPVNGLNLLWHSDLAVSGGGTMNREAAALGIPVYSIFRGPLGAIDRSLAAEGRLTLIASPQDVRTHIRLVKQHRDRSALDRERPALSDILAAITAIAKTPDSLSSS